MEGLNFSEGKGDRVDGGGGGYVSGRNWEREGREGKLWSGCEEINWLINKKIKCVPTIKGKVHTEPWKVVYNSAYLEHYLLSHIPTLQMEKKKHREATNIVHGCTAVPLHMFAQLYHCTWLYSCIIAHGCTAVLLQDSNSDPSVSKTVFFFLSLSILLYWASWKWRVVRTPESPRNLYIFLWISSFPTLVLMSFASRSISPCVWRH